MRYPDEGFNSYSFNTKTMLLLFNFYYYCIKCKENDNLYVLPNENRELTLETLVHIG